MVIKDLPKASELISVIKLSADSLGLKYSGSLIWIKTSQDTVYGKISAYSRKCDFVPGDRLYLKRVYQSPGLFGYWMYQIENDNNVWYRISEFQHDNKVLVQTWF